MKNGVNLWTTKNLCQYTDMQIQTRQREKIADLDIHHLRRHPNIEALGDSILQFAPKFNQLDNQVTKSQPTKKLQVPP